MKTHNPIGYYILSVAGVCLMAFFGSKMAALVAPTKFTAGNLLLSGYSVGLILVSWSMVVRLGAQVRDLQSKFEKLGSAKG